jgi:hypothetical protein
MENNERNLAVYVLLRTDLPSMNPGKAAAQVHHAGVQLTHHYNGRQLLLDYIDDGAASGADGFNTTIVLGASIDDIIQCKLMQESSNVECLTGSITDPSYPFIVENMEIAQLIPQHPYSEIRIVEVLENGKVLMVRPELTCAYYLGDRKDPKFTAIFKGLSLYP